MTTTRLGSIRTELNPLRQNHLLFTALRDDAERAALYGELRARSFPALRFKSLLRHGSNPLRWWHEDAYLVTSGKDIAAALQQGSVKPYAGLDSGGRFMLGMDEKRPHAAQRATARSALGLKDSQVAECVEQALIRTMVLPQKTFEFDLVKDVAEQAALRLMTLVFGLPAKSQVLLQKAMRATYTRLTFQIIGRHFVSDDGQMPPDAEKAVDLKARLEEQVYRAASKADKDEWWDEALQHPRALPCLADAYGAGNELTKIVSLGLIAGTVGNVTSAVANVFAHFFATSDQDGLLIDTAQDAARYDVPQLQAMIRQAMQCRPPAPFLARAAAKGTVLTGWGGEPCPVPEGANLVLALGADTPVDMNLMFGGAVDDPAYRHSCIGQHLAWPLIDETVRQVLLLPGLGRVIDPATAEPKPLVKRWGAICEEFPLRYQRDRRSNQQPLFLVLPIKEPVAENAFKLEALTRAGAPLVQRALDDARNVHFAWFGLDKDKRNLTMYTVYDGDFEAYVEHFALKVPLFDEQFKYLKDPPPSPVKDHPKEFVDMIRRHNHAPLADFFYSAYPRVGVADILNAGLERP
ncbi:cytochrome P450 [Ramlibacter sp. XY19]|uniref:hypothetical protein n=1 Tax=Ramlibacter paludis TaxID=2908000 RepID=UPI0023DA7C4D|nr:hypothetical protein [Ramlibacter paludis]MCG2595442.1 cytochrome P450 [Ramlibacter paludis]